jgi:hypothetical protein
MPFFLKPLQKFKRRDYFQIYFRSQTLAWYQSQTNIPQKNYRPISVLYTDAKLLN